MIASATHGRGSCHHEIKFAPLDLKTVDADGGFEGYASLFGTEDLARDVVSAGAFRKSLAARGAAGIKLLFQHDPNQPIGVWHDVHEDSKGLYARGRLMSEIARAREVLSLMRAGALDGLSIGFRAVKGTRDARTGVRRLDEIDLWEISIVTFPMLPEARVAAVKARPFDTGLPSARELERWLTREAGLTRSTARALMRSGYKSLAAMQDAAGGCEIDADVVERIRRATALVRPSSRR